ncbi:glycosyltransferase [Roseburia sp. 499]|uniref:glycosyltransferase n=1 Tax=Roseburia sp. 499 TaxID=1261634 RepID=UPI000953156B|nr:glycosyltransferase [Roseburia sp. 499]WVK69296.1 glycosyltransferase [Roseburia sp. 499]
MQKVLFVIPTLTGGGAERVVSTLSQYFPEEISTDVLLNSCSEKDYRFDGKIIELGMKPQVTKSFSYQLKAMWLRFWKLKKLKKSGQYCAVISFLESANIVNILTKNKKCKTIVSVRNVISQENNTSYRHIINLIVRLLYNRADKVVSLSKGVEKDLTENLKLNPKKNITIYNGYDISKMGHKSKESDKAEFTFITMGRNVEQKGQWHLIRAFSQVVKEYPNARLKILGQGNLEDYLKELIKGYQLEDIVLLEGFIKNPQSELEKADCFVFPSLFEGFGNSLIEALIAGLPVIASDFRYGAREILAPSLDITEENKDSIIEAEYGILIPVCSGKHYTWQEPLEKEEELMASAMINFLKNSNDNKYEKDKLKECVERFSIEKCIEDWKKVLV